MVQVAMNAYHVIKYQDLWMVHIVPAYMDSIQMVYVWPIVLNKNVFCVLQIQIIVLNVGLLLR